MLIKYERCKKCGERLYYETALMEQSHAYEFEGDIYCEDCLTEVAKEVCYTHLKEDF